MQLHKLRPIVSWVKSIKLKYLLITVTLILILIYIWIDFMLLRKRSKIISNVNLQNVVVHLDLKGSPPKLTYLMSLLPMLKRLGVTGFLMEYEDMFPYDGKLVNLSAINCYGRAELKEFISVAVKSGFEIIPLVQTFGHLEHALKLAEFQHLREIPFYPDSICPTQKESKDLIRDMLEQVIKFHDDIKPLKHFHIGCDEVYHINKCNKCRSQRLSDIDLYVNHINAVKGMVQELTPDTVILIWDDMLRSTNVSELGRIDIFTDVEPVYWDYKKQVELAHLSLFQYRNRFKDIWIASAFKGADGRIATLPNLTWRFMNHFSWLNSIREYKFGGDKEVFNFKGIILTGWSRYSHMDPPCELLPSSIPSLVLNLLLIRKFKAGIPIDYKLLYVDEFFVTFLAEDFIKTLNCDTSISIEYFDNSLCSFEGNELYTVQRLNDMLIENVKTAVDDMNLGISAVEYYRNSNNINRLLAERNEAWCNKILIDLLTIETQMVHELSKFFDRNFTVEYTNLKNDHVKSLLSKLSKILANASNFHTWPRRPYQT